MSANADGFGNILASQQRRAMQLTGRMLPGLARRAGAGGELLRHAIKKLEIRLNGFDKTIAVKPVTDIPCPMLDLATCDDPVAAIMATPEFDAAMAFFADNPVTTRSLETPAALQPGKLIVQAVLRGFDSRAESRNHGGGNDAVAPGHSGTIIRGVRPAAAAARRPLLHRQALADLARQRATATPARARAILNRQGTSASGPRPAATGT